jgi:hypothetical protein
MRRLIVAVALGCLFCIPGYAQDYPRVEVYGGYQLIMDDELIEDITYSADSVFDDYKRLHGFNAAFEYPIRSWIGIAGELGHGRTSPAIRHDISIAPYPTLSTEYLRNQTSFLSGPHFSYRGGGFRVFGHALFGGNHIRRGFTHVIGYEDGTKDIFEDHQSHTDFATAFGGGLDVSPGKLISFRPVQLDLLSTYRSYDAHHEDYNQHQFRYSAGIVFKFGSVNH